MARNPCAMDLAKNKKAYKNYEVLDTYEAGIVLVGTEVKSCRERNITMTDAHASIDRGELWLHSVHIAEYKAGNLNNHDPIRVRKLLLHRAEIDKIKGGLVRKGLTVVPLAFYLKRGRIKVKLGLCRGRKHYDKREDIKSRESKRDMREHQS